jgi:ABC-2 type transport system ATP-binding protein
MSPATSIVELDRISKAYDQKIAVHDLSLRIEPGTMFGLLGPNGAGKTSSIRMMIGVTLPDSGTVNLFGQPFTRKALARVGYLPEERGLYKKMKVIDQLVFMGQLHHLDAATANTRARQWAERLQIAGSIEKKTEELSKGMQQKIQFIATLLHDPDLIIMDEPFSGLDPVNAILLQDTLIDLKNQGRAILFSTHRMDQVEKLCDAISLVNNGTVVLSGTMREVKSRYERNRVLVEFEGDDSFLAHESIAEFKNYAGHVEVKLKDGADAQALLREAIAKARINKFELVEPSLEDIFIQTVGGKADA